MPLPRRVPGSQPGQFLQQGRGGVPGQRGQSTQLLHPFTRIGDKLAADRFEWPVDDLGAPDLDWADGDGLNPFVGPGPFVAGGAPAAGLQTPWQERDFSDVTCTGFDEGEHLRYNAAAFDPAVGDDIIFLLLARARFFAGGTSVLFSTRIALGTGWTIYQLANGTVTFLMEDTLAASVGSGTGPAMGWALWGVTVDRGARQWLYRSGTPDDDDDISGLGDVASGVGVAINSRCNGTQDHPSDIARAMVWYGVNLAATATAAWHLDVAQSVLGDRPDQGAAGDFARATGATWQNRNGVWSIGGTDTVRAGDSGGLRCSTTRTNQAYKNTDLRAGDAAVILTATGGVVSDVDDSVALTAAGAREFGPTVCQVANATGGVIHARMSQVTGSVVRRSLQALVRRSAGVGAVSLGLYDESAGTFVAGAAIHDGYDARTLVHGQTPADLDCTMCLEIADNTTVRFTAHDMSAGTRCTTPIPNTALAAAAIRNADEWTSDVTPLDLQGGVSLTATPLGWSAAETGGASLLWTVWGAQATLRVSAAGFWELALDGTTTLTSTVQPADGVANDIRFFWSTGGLITLTVDDDTQTGPYDGTIRWDGEWQLIAQIAEFAVRNFATYRNGSG